MPITQTIKELLYQYDCVIIPGFGGFIGSYDPARIHPVSHRFHPPGKKITFNKMLVMNDGLLAHHLATSQGRTYQSALEEIAFEILSWNKKLKKGQTVNLDGIGSFVHDSRGNLIFNPEKSENFLREAYGLTTFQAKPIDRSERATEKEIKRSGKLVAFPALDRMAKYSIAAAFLSIAMLTTYKLNHVPDLTLGKVTLNPFKSEPALYQTRDYNLTPLKIAVKTDNNMKILDGSNFSKFFPAGEDGPGFVIVEDHGIIEKMTANSGRYHVVGGCFGVKSNADNFLANLKRKGFQAHIPTKLNGLHVVSYQSFESRQQAEVLLKKVQQSENASAWILEK